MKYVLIMTVMFSTGGGSGSTAYFETKESCEIARARFANLNSINFGNGTFSVATAFCVEK